MMVPLPVRLPEIPCQESIMALLWRQCKGEARVVAIFTHAESLVGRFRQHEQDIIPLHSLIQEQPSLLVFPYDWRLCLPLRTRTSSSKWTEITGGCALENGEVHGVGAADVRCSRIHRWHGGGPARGQQGAVDVVPRGPVKPLGVPDIVGPARGQHGLNIEELSCGARQRSAHWRRMTASRVASLLSWWAHPVGGHTSQVYFTSISSRIQG